LVSSPDLQGAQTDREERAEELKRAFEEGSLGIALPPLIVLSLEGPLSVSELADRIGLTVAHEPCWSASE